MLRLVSRLTDPDFARRTPLLPEITVLATPLRGEVWHDSDADNGQRRSYARQRVAFGAVNAWHIPNALLSNEFIAHDRRNLYCDSSILVSGGKAADVERLSARMLASLAEASDREMIEDHAHAQVLALHNEGGGTWGHFLLQIFPKVLLFCQRFPDGKIAVPAPYANGKSTFAQLFDLYGIDRSRLIGTERGRTYRFGEIVLMDFMYDFASGTIHPAAFDLLDAYRPPQAAGGTPAAYVKRLPRADRGIANAREVEGVMACHGIAIGAMGAAQVEEQAGFWHGHDLVIGTLGSDLTNMVFARPGTQVLALSPDWFGDSFFYNLAVARGLCWNEIRCGEMADAREPQRQSTFVVDAALLDTALRRLLR